MTTRAVAAQRQRKMTTRALAAQRRKRVATGVSPWVQNDEEKQPRRGDTYAVAARLKCSIDAQKALTRSGSDCDPAQRRISASASSTERPGRYGRFVVSASKESATAMRRAPSGMALPFSPPG